MRDDKERLLDILEAIERIEQYSHIDEAYFQTNELVQVWMVHNIQIIGEATSRLSDPFKQRYPNVPWKAIAGMRNAIVHAYFKVDLDEVWNAVQKDLPQLKNEILLIVESYDKI